MDRHCASALTVARYLAGHSAVTEVRYPGFDEHPGHEVAARQMSGFGGMVAFRTGDVEKALEVCARTRVFTLAESLGGVESLIEHPVTMTHASVPAEALERMGITPDLIRISVGIEDLDDLLADLDAALQ
jgi:cystathionine gamma-synthase